VPKPTGNFKTHTENAALVLRFFIKSIFIQFLAPKKRPRAHNIAFLKIFIHFVLYQKFSTSMSLFYPLFVSLFPFYYNGFHNTTPIILFNVAQKLIFKMRDIGFNNLSI